MYKWFELKDPGIEVLRFSVAPQGVGAKHHYCVRVLHNRRRYQITHKRNYFVLTIVNSEPVQGVGHLSRALKILKYPLHFLPLVSNGFSVSLTSTVNVHSKWGIRLQ